VRLTLPTIPEEPSSPIDAQKDDQEIKQRLLNMQISSLGDMRKDKKNAKIVCWILHFDKKVEEEEEQQPDIKGEEQEQKQPAEEKNNDAQAKNPDKTAKVDKMGEDEQPKKKPASSAEESSEKKQSETCGRQRCPSQTARQHGGGRDGRR